MSRTYFVECYWPGVDELRLARASDRLVAATRDSDEVTWIDSVLIPEDEIVLCLAEGSSMEAVRASAQEAGVPAERIVPCVHIPLRTLEETR